MATEIERKFLVTSNDWRTPHGERICQGYLNRDKERTVRIRLRGPDAFITIKGISVGARRAEFEYAIPLADAKPLLALCEKPLIDKTRHTVEHAGSTWEIDEFHGDNAGLVVAEIELNSEDQPFERPPWLGAEVTHDPRYFNAQLAAHPYCEWREPRS